MCRSLLRIVWPLASLSLLAFSATALADDPERLTLSASSTRETCTLGSVTTLDYDIQGGQPPYQLTVDGRAVDQSAEPHYIPCRASAPLSRLGPPGSHDIQRMIVSLTDVTGARAYAVAEHRLLPPLPAPTFLQVSSGLAWDSEVNLSAEWRTPFSSGTQRTTDFAIRWRVEGTSDWTIEHHRSTGRPVFSFRDSWTIDAPLAGERRELQVAQLRHLHDLKAPQVLRWSHSAFVTTAAHPYEVQAEATHDTITLSWGPHATGLAFEAELDAVEDRSYTKKEIRLEDGSLFEARFGVLLPDTLYRVEVCLAERSGYCRARDQHRFEIRTESAPDGWSAASRVATDIRAVYVDGEIEVTWTPPEVGARHDTRVCLSQSEVENFNNWTCSTVAPGESRASVSGASYGWQGGTYQVEVSVLAPPVERAERQIHIPTYDPDLPTRGEPPAAPRFVEMRWFLHPENPAPGTWTFEWEAEPGDRVEVMWRIGDRWFTREYPVSVHREGQFHIISRPQVRPEQVRYRILREGAWTPRSLPTDTPDLTTPPYVTEVTEYRDHIWVRWDPPGSGRDTFDYRLYITRNQRQEEALDLGSVTQARVQIRAEDRQYEFQVAALVEGDEEVMRSYRRQYERERLSLHVHQPGSWCQPFAEDRARINWTVIGGATPFTISIADRLGFETEQRHGSTLVDCIWSDDGSQANLTASIQDAHGDSAADTLDLSESPNHWAEGSSDPGIALGIRSVHRDRVLLSWTCYHSTDHAALRWRIAGAPDWTYVADVPRSWEADWTCRGVLDGLQPSTTYEYQLARIDQHADVRRLEQVRWTTTQTMTTLGPPQELVIERERKTVSVSWQRQPEAWGYVVGLRAEGRSWWKRYEPSGEPTEQIRFYRIPEGLDFTVELISPPLEDGEEARPWGFDANPNIYHE